MTAEMIVKINKYCNRYGDKLVELMEGVALQIYQAFQMRKH